MAIIKLKSDRPHDTATARGRLAAAIEEHRDAKQAAIRAALALSTAVDNASGCADTLAAAMSAMETARTAHADKVIAASLSHAVMPAAALREQRLALGDAEDDLAAAQIAVERLRGPADEAEEAVNVAAFEVTVAAADVIREQAIAFLGGLQCLQAELIRKRLAARWLLSNGLLPQGPETAAILNELRMNARLPSVEAGPFGEPDMVAWRSIDPAPSLETMRNSLEQHADVEINLSP